MPPQRCTVLALVAALWFAALPVASRLVAQTPETCAVRRNNEPFFYVDPATHPVTGRNFNHAVFQPPGYLSNQPSDPGVAAGAQVWRWIPSQVNQRFETRLVTGFYVWLRPSAATSQYPSTGYVPEWSMWEARPRAGAGFEMDPTQAPKLVVPSATFPFTSAFAQRARVAFSAAVPIDAEEVCYSFRFQGGEHRFRAGSQGLVGTVDEAPFLVSGFAGPVATWGFADAAGNPTVVDPTAVFGGATSTVWGGYYEDQPSLMAESNYAHLRRTSGQIVLYTGYNDAVGVCDLASMPVDIGWNVEVGVGRAGAVCIPLLEIASALPSPLTRVGIPFGNGVLEVDPLQPLAGGIAEVGYLGRADATGFYNGPRLPLGSTGSALLGFYLGVEFLVFDASLSGTVDTTQAVWTFIAL